MGKYQLSFLFPISGGVSEPNRDRGRKTVRGFVQKVGCTPTPAKVVLSEDDENSIFGVEYIRAMSDGGNRERIRRLKENPAYKILMNELNFLDDS